MEGSGSRGPALSSGSWLFVRSPRSANEGLLGAVLEQ